MCKLIHTPPNPIAGTLTDEEDGEGDEEDEDVRHHIERVQEAAVVQDTSVHVVRKRVVLDPAERQGHVGARTLRAGGKPAGRRGETGRQTGEFSEHVVTLYSLREHGTPRASPSSFKKAQASLLHPPELPCAESSSRRHRSGERG